MKMKILTIEKNTNLIKKGFKVTQPILLEKNSLNSNDGSIVETSVKSVIGTKILPSKIWLNCLVYERQITIVIPATWNLFYVTKPTILAALPVLLYLNMFVTN